LKLTFFEEQLKEIIFKDEAVQYFKNIFFIFIILNISNVLKDNDM